MQQGEKNNLDKKARKKNKVNKNKRILDNYLQMI